MAGVKVRRLRERDIGRAIELTDLEHWGYTPADFRRLLALAPEGCFAAELNDHVVGVLSTTTYGPVAYLGAVIVDPSVRGQGVGEAMMHAALGHLDSSGVETVVLNAYLNVIPFYEKLGFRRGYENRRWEGSGTGVAADDILRVQRSDLESVLAFDADYFGASRGALLERLASEFPESFLVSKGDGGIDGYVVGNPSGESCEIGPWVVRPGRRSVAASLFGGILRATQARSFAFTGPSVNPDVVAFARDLRLHEAFRTVRMVRGRVAFHGRPEGIWAFAGLEKG